MVPTLIAGDDKDHSAVAKRLHKKCVMTERVTTLHINPQQVWPSLPTQHHPSLPPTPAYLPNPANAIPAYPIATPTRRTITLPSRFGLPISQSSHQHHSLLLLHFPPSFHQDGNQPCQVGSHYYSSSLAQTAEHPAFHSPLRFTLRSNIPTLIEMWTASLLLLLITFGPSAYEQTGWQPSFLITT